MENSKGIVKFDVGFINLRIYFEIAVDVLNIMHILASFSVIIVFTSRAFRIVEIVLVTALGTNSLRRGLVFCTFLIGAEKLEFFAFFTYVYLDAKRTGN